MEKCDKCGEFIEFARLCPLCAHYEKEILKRSAKKCEERMRKAEELVQELVVVIDTLLVWWRSGNNVCKDCPNTSGPVNTCISECCDFLDDYKQANSVLDKVKEVLGDG